MESRIVAGSAFCCICLKLPAVLLDEKVLWKKSEAFGKINARTFSYYRSFIKRQSGLHLFHLSI